MFLYFLLLSFFVITTIVYCCLYLKIESEIEVYQEDIERLLKISLGFKNKYLNCRNNKIVRHSKKEEK